MVLSFRECFLQFYYCAECFLKISYMVFVLYSYIYKSHFKSLYSMFISDMNGNMLHFLLYFVVFFKACGSVVNDTLTSPGYPNNYLSRMECDYSIPIPDGMTMLVDFHEFDLQPHISCR